MVKEESAAAAAAASSSLSVTIVKSSAANTTSNDNAGGGNDNLLDVIETTPVQDVGVGHTDADGGSSTTTSFVNLGTGRLVYTTGGEEICGL
jgi:hypothetical protein